MNASAPGLPFVWQGRIDAEETGVTTRWHQHVRPWHAQACGGVALLGFACDEGVRRNGGRPGAAQGPAALRQALANLPVLGEPTLWDSGDVTCEGQALEAAQAALAARVAEALAQGAFPLVLGGGHEVAWGTFQGIVQAEPKRQRLLIVNFDAHFDLRQAAQANSGTPFRQIAQWCQAQGRPFDYHVLGISRYANTQALFDRAHVLGVRYRLDEALQTEADVAAARTALQADLAACDAVYLTICLDVLPAHQAPGVSAPATLGVPLPWLISLMDTVLASGKVVAADIAELNPALDRDGQTARTGARLAAHIARALSLRMA
jgi:formiminoglutamase